MVFNNGFKIYKGKFTQSSIGHGATRTVTITHTAFVNSDSVVIVYYHDMSGLESRTSTINVSSFVIKVYNRNDNTSSGDGYYHWVRIGY